MLIRTGLYQKNTRQYALRLKYHDTTKYHGIIGKSQSGDKKGKGYVTIMCIAGIYTQVKINI